MYIEGGSKNLSTYFVNNSLYEMSLEMTLQIIGWWWQSNSYFQIPNTKLSQKRFKNRKKKKTDQVVVEQQIQQVEEIVEFDQVWSNLIKFDPIWSNLIPFPPICSNFFHFDQVWSYLIQLSNLIQSEPIWSKSYITWLVMAF